MRVHQAPSRAWVEIGRRWWNRRKRINTEAPVLQLDVRAGHDIRRATDAKSLLEDRGVGLLNHEQRNVLEDVPVVKAIAAAENVLRPPGEVVGKANAGAEV